MKRSCEVGGLLIALCAAPVAWTGPAEVNGLSTQLQHLETEVRAAEDRMRAALRDRSGAAGDEGTRLRALKQERERVRQVLQQATADERRRAAASGTDPGQRPTARPPAPAKPKVQATPAGELMPAPSL